MKQETNNEMDLLLRRLGRRPDISVSDANGDVEHLDADELNAYAENVAPAAARARYTEHLAECARCREVVVQLSSAAGVIPVAETLTAAEPSALKKFLATLFSPMVLRYAVPALGLIVVAAIGLVVLKQMKSEDGSIAQNASPQTPTSITKTNEGEPPSAAFNKYDAAKPLANTPSTSSASPETHRGAPTATPQAGPGDDASRDSLAKSREQQPVTGGEAPPPKAADRIDEGKLQAEKQARKEAPSVQVANEPAPAKTAEVASVENRKASEPAASSPAPAAKKVEELHMAQGAVARSRAQRNDEDEKDKSDAETKIVAGRHFRKQGGIWVDTAYNFSRSATSLTRGSEQYRALIADEPSIKTIADELDGEILVVWKGRPYRIR